jgi:hypothetical protein
MGRPWISGDGLSPRTKGRVLVDRIAPLIDRQYRLIEEASASIR